MSKSVEERIAVVETKQDDTIRILKEVRDDVRSIAEDNNDHKIRLSSLEQSRTTGRKMTGILGVPIIGIVCHHIAKVLGLY
jgi:hypothetical protein